MAFKPTGNASKDMGTLLLSGWAMLEDTCEGKLLKVINFQDCNIPLMRNRAKDSELCVQCQRDYLKKTGPVAQKQEGPSTASKQPDPK